MRSGVRSACHLKPQIGDGHLFYTLARTGAAICHRLRFIALKFRAFVTSHVTYFSSLIPAKSIDYFWRILNPEPERTRA